MKAVVSFFFILMVGAIALANTAIDVQINRGEVDVVLDHTPKFANPTSQNEVHTNNNIVRLYRFKNSRVQKALSFATKYNKAKLV